LADFDPRELHFLDREEAIGYCMKITAAALRAFQQMKTSILNLRDRINFFRMYPSGAFAGTSHTLGVVDSIQDMGTESQISKWLPLAMNYQLIGAFASTEIGHGLCQNNETNSKTIVFYRIKRSWSGDYSHL
jgi:acyl-CoA oxidase